LHVCWAEDTYAVIDRWFCNTYVVNHLVKRHLKRQERLAS